MSLPSPPPTHAPMMPIKTRLPQTRFLVNLLLNGTLLLLFYPQRPCLLPFFSDFVCYVLQYDTFTLWRKRVA